MIKAEKMSSGLVSEQHMDQQNFGAATALRPPLFGIILPEVYAARSNRPEAEDNLHHE